MAGAVEEVQQLSNQAVDTIQSLGNRAVDLGQDELGLAFEAVANIFQAAADMLKSVSQAVNK